MKNVKMPKVVECNDGQISRRRRITGKEASPVSLTALRTGTWQQNPWGNGKRWRVISQKNPGCFECMGQGRRFRRPLDGGLGGQAAGGARMPGRRAWLFSTAIRLLQKTL